MITKAVMILAMIQRYLRPATCVSHPIKVGRRDLNLGQLHSAHSVSEGLRR